MYQQAFQQRVASKLVAAGFKIRRTEHAFELSNVSRELIERFSKRTMQVVGTAPNGTGKSLVTDENAGKETGHQTRLE